MIYNTGTINAMSMTQIDDRHAQWMTTASNTAWTGSTMRTIYTGTHTSTYTGANTGTHAYVELEFYSNTRSSVSLIPGNAHTYRAYDYDYAKPIDIKSTADCIKEMLRKRQFPAVTISNSKPMGHAFDNREVRARETLRRVIGEDKYNRFLKQGWVSVKARSGLVYRIYPGHGITEVYDKGTVKERLCVVLKGNFPPTDSVIIRYLLILNNEQMFRGKAIKHSVPGGQYQRVQMQPEERSIIEIARDIRKGGTRKVG